jgi:hypothetical protein
VDFLTHGGGRQASSCSVLTHVAVCERLELARGAADERRKLLPTFGVGGERRELLLTRGGGRRARVPSSGSRVGRRARPAAASAIHERMVVADELLPAAAHARGCDLPARLDAAQPIIGGRYGGRKACR